MSRHFICSIGLLLSLAASPAHPVNGNIGIYPLPECCHCGADLGLNTPLVLYVFALLQGSSQSGFQGAEYRISTLFETDWLFLEDFSPSSNTGAIILGTAMGGATPGVNIAFPSCQTGPHKVLLQYVTVLDVTGTFANQWNQLTVEAHTTPGNPFFRCPLFNLCDAPAFTKVCLGSNVTTEQCPFPPGAMACLTSTSGEFYINPDPCECCLNVESDTWSEVKRLFR